ncbi:MAG TPA: hypothetical protein VH518_03885 [Tepidisphaeraceae bacterium]
MRIIRLLAYFTLGYAVYQIYLGVMRESAAANARMAGGGGPRSRNLSRALNEDRGRMNVTGPNSGARRGTTVEVDDAGGGHSKRTVGRGVVER